MRGQTCGIFLVGITEKWAFTPCGHHPFCETCSESDSKQLGHTFIAPCPISRREEYACLTVVITTYVKCYYETY